MLGALLLLLAAYPYLLDDRGGVSTLLLVLTSVVLLSSVHAVCRTGSEVLVAAGLLAPAFSGNWWSLADAHPLLAGVLMLSLAEPLELGRDGQFLGARLGDEVESG